MNNVKKSKNNDYFLMLSAVLLLIIVGFTVNFSVKKKLIVQTTEQPKMEIIGNIILTIDFGSGKKRSFEGSIVKGETPIDAFIQASKAGNVSYKFDEKSSLAAIGSFVNNNKKSWRWYLNGKKSSKSLNEIILKNADNILIKYE